MRRLTLALVATLLPGALAAQQMQIDVTEGAVATAIVDRAPEGTATTFPADVGELYCFTRIVGAAPGTQIQHVWFQGDTERARVSLNIGSANWRTWSSKTIPADWTGSWRVEVQTADGTVLETLSFTVG